MTVKEASTLKKGDKVVLTRDSTVYRVTKVKVWSARDVDVSFGKPVRTLRGSAALRSLSVLRGERDGD